MATEWNTEKLYVINETSIDHDTLTIAECACHAWELIRCKDCKKHGKPECPVQILFPNDGISHTDDDWYCADGEREGR